MRFIDDMVNKAKKIASREVTMPAVVPKVPPIKASPSTNQVQSRYGVMVIQASSNSQQIKTPKAPTSSQVQPRYGVFMPYINKKGRGL